jgi:Na+-driven multidrug efflux pump
MSFLKVRIWGLPFLYIYQMRNALLVGTNQSRYLVPGTVAEALANIVLDYFLILGIGTWEGLGFEGAAYASIAAEFTGMFVIFLVIRRKDMHKQFALFAAPAPDAVLAKSIVRISAPLVFQYAISIVSWLFFYILIERNTDETSMAISNTMRTIIGFFGVFSWAFAATASSMVSNLIGQGKTEAVLPLLWKIVKLSGGFSLLVCALLNGFPAAYFSIYGLSASFAAAGVPVLRVVAAAMVLMSVATVWLNGVTGSGRSDVTFGIEIIAIVLYCVFTYIVLEHLQLSIVWGWASELLYWTCLYALSFLYLKSGRWRRFAI